MPQRRPSLSLLRGHAIRRNKPCGLGANYGFVPALGQADAVAHTRGPKVDHSRGPVSAQNRVAVTAWGVVALFPARLPG